MMDPATHYYGEVAVGYEAQRLTQREWKLEHNAVARWLDDIPRRSTVLDAPVGTGRFLRLYESCDLICLGVDISSDMLAEAQAKGTCARFRQLDILGPVCTLISDVAVCMRFANWVDSGCLVALFRFLSSHTMRKVLIGIATSHGECALCGGAHVHIEADVLTAISGVGLIVEARETITLTAAYQYDIWSLRHA